MSKKMITVCGLNPAWQKTLHFEHFIPETVNRAKRVMEMPSGKGINVVRAIRTWGAADGRVFQFAGGGNGEKLLAGLDAEGIPHRSIRIAGSTRCCNTVLCHATHGMTELIEPSAKVTDQELLAMFDAILESLETADALALCGTYPPGVPETFYAELTAEARKRNVFVFMDAFTGIASTLDLGVDLLKINLDELYALSGENTPEKAFDVCFRKYKIKAIAVTDGKNPALLSQGETPVRIPVPVVAAPVNPIGSGDTCSGVMLSEILNGTALHDAFRCGLAAASANCLTDRPAVFDRASAEQFLTKGE